MPSFLRAGRALRGALAASALALATAGCDIGPMSEDVYVTTDRLSYDFRVPRLQAGQPVTVSSVAALTITGRIPGGFSAQQVAEAYVESVRVEQIVPSGAVIDLGSLQDVTFSLNGQHVAANASLSSTTAPLLANGVNAGGVFTSNDMRGSLRFTPTRSLGEEYGLRVSFVARIVVRGI